MDFIFTIPGKPQGKARARTVRNKYTGKVHSFTPEKTQSYEDLIRWCFKDAGGVYMQDKMLDVYITAWFPIPKSFTKAKRQEIYSSRLFPTTKPDCDNIIKVVLDALNGIAYEDDKQVVSLTFKKFYTATDPCITVGLRCYD